MTPPTSMAPTPTPAPAPASSAYDSAAGPTALDVARRSFRDELIGSGILVETDSLGLYGRSEAFEDIMSHIQSAVAREVGPATRTRLRFPAVYPRSEFEHTDYIASFPHLTGTIHTFAGNDKAHAELMAARADGRDWDEWLSSTDAVLVPAACHPLYARLSGSTVPEGGTTYDVLGEVFRHEPSEDPMRMQAFHQYEFVFIGDAGSAREFRQHTLGRLIDLVRHLGLDAHTAVANDPFFGRAGRMLARNQQADSLKTEITVSIYGELAESTAIASGNSHLDHFGSTFGISLPDGTPAHSACVGVGLERTALALIRTYGIDPRNWPTRTRSILEA